MAESRGCLAMKPCGSGGGMERRHALCDQAQRQARQDVTRPENGDKGSIYGLELAWQQTFDMLRWAARNVSAVTKTDRKP